MKGAVAMVNTRRPSRPTPHEQTQVLLGLQTPQAGPGQPPLNTTAPAQVAGAGDVVVGHPRSSLTSALRDREQVVHATTAVAESLEVGAEHAEVLLISESNRLGVPAAALARWVHRHPQAALSWRAQLCAQCRGEGRLRVFGDYALVRVLVCPEGHGVFTAA